MAAFDFVKTKWTMWTLSNNIFARGQLLFRIRQYKKSGNISLAKNNEIMHNLIDRIRACHHG